MLYDGAVAHGIEENIPKPNGSKATMQSRCVEAYQALDEKGAERVAQNHAVDRQQRVAHCESQTPAESGLFTEANRTVHGDASNKSHRGARNSNPWGLG